MREAIVAAFLLLLGSTVLGATVFAIKSRGRLGSGLLQ
jgi:hypothetical protein